MWRWQIHLLCSNNYDVLPRFRFNSCVLSFHFHRHTAHVGTARADFRSRGARASAAAPPASRAGGAPAAGTRRSDGARTFGGIVSGV